MSTPDAQAAPTARLAATVLLLRDGPHGLEVFMVVRHQQIDFASGALVFPGGKLAEGDRHPDALTHCSGVEGLSADEIALRIGAIREAFEECGVLLARPRGSDALVTPERLEKLGPLYRKRLDRGELGIAEMLIAEDLVLACEMLVPFAHWITPTFMPKRFDTYFYVAVAPSEQIAGHDGFEAVDSVWIRPADAEAEVASGTRVMVPVTLINVRKLGESDSAASAIAASKARRIVTVQPELLQKKPTIRLRIPAEAGYGITEFEFPAEKG